MQVVTAVAADDLERVPVAAFLATTLQDADRLAPDARGDAMPKLTSQRDSHNITELNAGPQITGMAPMPPQTPCEPLGDGIPVTTCEASALNTTPPQVGSATAGVWSSATLSASIATRSCGGKCRPELDHCRGRRGVRS